VTAGPPSPVAVTAGPPAPVAASTVRTRPTRLGSALLSVALLVGALALRAGAPGLHPLVALLVAPFPLALLRRSRLRDLRVGLPPTVQVEVGAAAVVPVSLVNVGSRRLPRLLVGLGVPGALQAAPLVVEALEPGGGRTAPVPLTALRRGVHGGVFMEITEDGSLGVLRRTLRTSIAAEVVAVPRSRPLSPPPEPTGRGGDDAPAPDARPLLHGVQPQGTRDFRPGDEPRSVHWRATARTGRLTVREWDPPAALGLALLVQLAPDSAAPVLPDRPAGSGLEADELLLEAVASTGLAALLAGRRVAVVQARPAPEGRAVVETAGHLDPDGLLRVLAQVEPLRTELAAPAASAVAAAGPGGTVVFFAGIGWGHWEAPELLTLADTARAAGCQLLVVLGRSADGPVPQGAGRAFGDLARRVPVVTAAELLGGGDGRPWPVTLARPAPLPRVAA